MIDFIDLSKTYANGTKALNHFNLHIDDGEFVFVVGASGAGKSTFLKIIMREEISSAGRAVVNGQNLNELSPRKVPYYRRRLGIVFQDFRLIPTKTVYENVAFALHVTGAKQKEISRRVTYALNMVGLSSKAKCLPNELSGGEQQRVALARAILKDAPIIVLDEATAFADPENEALIQEALKTLTKGRTVVMIAHRLSTVVGADRIVVLDNGKVVEEGTHEALASGGGLYEQMWKEYNQAVQWKIASGKEGA